MQARTVRDYVSSPSSSPSPAEDAAAPPSETGMSIDEQAQSSNLYFYLPKFGAAAEDTEARVPSPGLVEVKAPQPIRWDKSPACTGHILSTACRHLYHSTLDMLPPTPWYPGQREEMHIQVLGADWVQKGKPVKTGRVLGGHFQYRICR
ncbi:hypothetical protein AZE42_13326 [Rhizopogon vesiculosus]|uniref:Uncharacterized protein n=1 Tax=Rhizopogon vesiculosus TaxID=180088 RepID=A0A1J8PVE4_9AGAM|nr:hypothetical protein AZE42_13326 [Rhizopogon vesiculosus]